ncbi:50S ribosomal protein L5 [bacterium]|nr:50S ribosomal protein L5 [bacterium]
MRLKEKYKKEVIKQMKEKFGYKNNLAVPKIIKVVVNVGLNKAKVEKDPKYIESVEQNIMAITGQKPIKTKAKKSISEFKIKKGAIVGLKVTLRKDKMYDFLDKLINIALPRTRDFRGIPLKSITKTGDLAIGLKEHLVFPEIIAEKVEKIHGLEVCIHTSAKNKEEAKELFSLLGFPFSSK